MRRNTNFVCMRKWLLSYLVISKKERTGALLLALLISCIWILPKIFHQEEPDPEVIRLAEQALAQKPIQEEVLIHELQFRPFDPNSADDETWLNMGITPRNLQTIRRFQSKGGMFRDKEDLLKIYGIRPDVISRIMPYARIKFDKASRQNKYAYESYKPPAPYVHTPRTFAKRTVEVVDLANADTTALIALPGIGPTLARRIIQFRDKCGGFYSPDQVGEVYGLRDSVFQLIKPYLRLEDTILQKLAINNISIDSLAAHPYITYSEARAIVKFRDQHGPFRQLDELLKIALLTPAWLRKVGPYLQFN